MTYPLVPRPEPPPGRRPGQRLTLEQLAAAVGLHPQLVRRLVALGLLEPAGPPGGPLEFAAAQVAVASRIVRLRAGLALNYAAVGVVLDLLTRVEELEAALRARPADRRTAPWT